MKLVTAAQMREIDRRTIEERGVPAGELMNRAGRAVAQAVLERFEPDCVAIVTGRGNNGGDGYVAARELHAQGVPVKLFLLDAPERLTGAALAAWQAVPAEIAREVAPTAELLRTELPAYDVIVDAIFGTGIRGPVGEPYAGAIAAINASRAPVVAVDIPSGLPADGPPAPNQPAGPWVRAALTVTIGLPKLGLMVDPGLRAAGQVVVEEIDFPADLLDDPALPLNLTTLEDARALLPDRSPAGHKGSFGRVLVAGGCEGMTGAAILATRAAARSGAGLIYVAYPAALGAIFESQLIEPVKLPLPGNERWFGAGHARRVIDEAHAMDAVALGPGLGRRPETQAFVHELLAHLEAPLVLDADGLNLVAEHPALLGRRPGPTILTPHPGEAARLLGCTVADVEADRTGVAVEFAARHGVVFVLKGAQTVVVSPEGQCYINPSGNSGLAKGGSGDVLTGLLAGLLAQGMEPLDAARLGVFLHGLAADQAARKLGVRAMLPSDVIEHLGAGFGVLEGRGAN